MGKEFDLMAAAAELTSEGSGAPSESGATEAAGASAEATQGNAEASGEPKTSAHNDGQVKELSPEEILKQVSEEKESPEAEKQILDQINALNLIHKGNAFKAESVSQVKELLQKGFDYTQKTMAHAEEAKAKAEEFQKMEAEFKTKSEALVQQEQKLASVVSENQVMESIIARMQQDDPELFDHIAKLYRAEVASFERQKPIVGKFEGEIGELRKQIGELKNGSEKEKLSKIKEGWEKDLSDVQAKFAPALNKLGVKASWDKVKETWAADVSGKMSVEQALYAVHGQDIAKANESYKKMLATKNKTQSALLNRNATSAGSSGTEKETIKAKAGDYESILAVAAKQLT